MTTQTSQQQPDVMQHRILVIDDFGPAREVYVRILQAAGFRVEEAGNGPEGLEKAFALQPALIVMDLLMPGMDGWAAVRRLKADSRTTFSPIVVITGAPHSDGARRAHEAGCDAYIIKPCLPQTLLRVVRDLLKISPRVGTGAEPRPGAASV
jgi:two-component system, cell cycle response regulator DivK